MTNQIGVVVFGGKSCGKSTVCGQILYRYGDIDDNALKKAKDATKEFDNKENCEYAFLCDTRDQERRYGTSGTHLLTFRASEQIYTLIDTCSGGKNQNKLVRRGFGECRIGILILETYKDKNIFNDLINNKSDIYKYMVITHTFGIQQIIICINKIDKKGIEFDEKLYKEYCESIKTMLVSVGYEPNNIPIIPISSYNGDNLFKASSDGNLKWWKGFEIKSKSNDQKIHKITSLIKGIKYLSKKAKPLNRINSEAPLLMTIKARLEIKDVGTVFLSGIDQGTMKLGQTVLCCKSFDKILVKKYKIKSIQTHGKDINIAKFGDIVGFTFTAKISDIEKKQQPNIGDIVCSAHFFKLQLIEQLKKQQQKELNYLDALPSIIKYVPQFTALIIILSEDIVGKQILRKTVKKYNNDLVFRTQTLYCNLQIVIKCKREDNKMDNPLQKVVASEEITNGEEAEVVFSTKNPNFVATYDSINSYSRFVIMKQKKPIGIGKIVSIG